MENPSVPARVVAAGEALIDLVEQPGGALLPHAGGAVYNLARALALQGADTLYLNALSADRFGRLLAQGLHAAGVQLAQAQPVREPTSLALVSVDGAGKPAYSFYREGVADRVGDAQALIDATRRHPGLRLACTGCLALLPQDRERYLGWLLDCRARGLLVAVDANLRPAVARGDAAYRANVRAALALADLIKVSDDDLALLSPDIPDPQRAAAQLFELGPARLVALTRGAEGAQLMARDGRCVGLRESAPLRVADTVGAGDCFFAGLLAQILEWPATAAPLEPDTPAMERALARAVACASLCVQRAGCVPPTAAEVHDWLAQGTIARI